MKITLITIILCLGHVVMGQVEDSTKTFNPKSFDLGLTRGLWNSQPKSASVVQPLVGRHYQSSKEIDLRINHFYESFPASDYYTNGKHFITAKELTFPPYHDQIKYVSFFKKRE